MVRPIANLKGVIGGGGDQKNPSFLDAGGDADIGAHKVSNKNGSTNHTKRLYRSEYVVEE